MNKVSNLSWFDYQRSVGANCSAFLKDSPAHSKQYLDDLYDQLSGKAPLTARPAFKIGSIVHSLILTPDIALDGIVVMGQEIKDANWQSEKRQNFYRETLGLGAGDEPKKFTTDQFTDASARKNITVINDQERKQILGMANSILQNKTARAYLEAGDKSSSEVSLFAEIPIEDEMTQGKSRLDFLPPNGNMILDIKTAASVSDHDFQRSIHEYEYAERMSFYLSSSNKLVEEGVLKGELRTTVVLIAVEKTPPFATRVFQLARDWLIIGQRNCEKKLAAFHRAQTTGIWPGYPEGVQILQAPKWAL